MKPSPSPSDAAGPDGQLSDEAHTVRQAVPSDELLGLLALGQANGSLSMNEVMEVFKDVDPTPEVIMGIRETLAAAGITFEEDEPEELHFEAHPELDDHGPHHAEPRPDGIAPVVPLTPKPADEAEPTAEAADEVPKPKARMTSRERVDKMRAARRAAAPASTGAADPVRMYLKEIGRVDLLKGTEEVALAERIERGLIAEAEMAELVEAEKLATISGAKRAQLDADIADGDKAKSALTQANLRLVVSIAKRYVGRGMALLDLVQEGNLGLMRAVEKFDHRKGFKFSTYATWWIRQSITRSIADQARTIRIPVHMVETMNRVKRTQRQMHQELERDPTIEELAERCDLSPDKTREILRISMDPLSLDSPVGSEDDSYLGDFIRDDRVEAPADVAARRLLGQAVLEVLDELNDREKDVVRLRFGLDGGRPRTLEEVGKEFGVTRERIRQIEAKTLAKLRHPHRSDKLRGYLDGQN